MIEAFLWGFGSGVVLTLVVVKTDWISALWNRITNG